MKMKRIIIGLLVAILCVVASGCVIKRPEKEDVNEGGDTTYANVELYSYTYAMSQKSQNDYETNNNQSFTYDILQKNDVFFINVRLIDVEDLVDFIFLVEINDVKYRFADDSISKITRDVTNKTVDFSVKIVYDGVTSQYKISKIIILSELDTQYYTRISEDCKPVILPTNKGDGSKENPYLVYNAKMLSELMMLPSKTYFKQANDIDLSTISLGDKDQNGQGTVLDNWEIIGTTMNPFTSFYDGGNFRIKRLSIQRFDNYYAGEGVGLFGTINDAVISNVILEDYRIETRVSRTTGALVGFAENSVITNCKLIQGKKENFESGSWSFNSMGGLIGFGKTSVITNCDVKSDLGLYCNPDANVPLNGMLGGVIGELFKSQIINCTFDGNLEGSAVVGGIVGRSDESLIAGVENLGNVKTGYLGGGICGQMWRSTLIFSSNKGVVSSISRADMPTYISRFLGGLVGEAGMNYLGYEGTGMNLTKATSMIGSCEFSGEISSSIYEKNAGGVAGKIFDCMISDIIVGGSFNIRYASIFSPEMGDGEKQIANAIVTTTISGGEFTSFIDYCELINIFYDSSKMDLAISKPIGVIGKDLTQLTVEELLNFDETIWNKTPGQVPTLKYTSKITQEMIDRILNGGQ